MERKRTRTKIRNKIRNAKLPRQSTFCTTEEARLCADILALLQGLSFGEFVHNALEAYNEAALLKYYGGISPQEMIKQVSLPHKRLKVQIGTKTKVAA